MRLFRDNSVTDYCSCIIGIQYIPVHKSQAGVPASLLLLPWMACMQDLQEQKPATKKSLFLKMRLSRYNCVLL
jgi:hypothetical protein